jgi:hypothetical protein
MYINNKILPSCPIILEQLYIASKTACWSSITITRGGMISLSTTLLLLDFTTTNWKAISLFFGTLKIYLKKLIITFSKHVRHSWHGDLVVSVAFAVFVCLFGCLFVCCLFGCFVVCLVVCLFCVCLFVGCLLAVCLIAA